MSNLSPANWTALFRKPWDWLFILFISVAALLRFYLLGAKSLWLVEAFSVYVARLPWHDFLRTMWWGEANMALYYLLLRGWIRLGDSEFWLRSLSVLFGVLAIPAIYALARRFFSRKAALAAAGLLAAHSFHIQYSQELRSYTLVTLLVILSFYSCLAILEAPNRRSPWILWILFSAMAIYAHIFAVLALASQWLIALAKFKRLGVSKLMAAGAAMVVLTAPVAAVAILERKGQLDWVPPLNSATFLELLDDIVGAPPRASLQGVLLLTFYLAVWLLAFGSAFLVRRNQTENTARASVLPLLMSWLTFPIVVMIGISLFRPIQAPRYLLMCVPAAVLLAGWAFVAIEELVPRGRFVSASVLGGVAILTVWSTWNYYASFRTYGHNGRALTKYILSNQKPGDAVIFYTFSGHYVFEYYANRQREAGVATTTPVVLFPLALERSNVEDRTQAYPRVWLVLHQTRSTPFTDAQTELLRSALETHFRLTDELKFRGSGKDVGETGSILVALYAAVSPSHNTGR